MIYIIGFVAARNRLYYVVNDPAYQTAIKAARKNNKDGQKSFKRVLVKNAFTDKGIKQAKTNMDILKDTALELEKAVADGMPLSVAALIIEGSYQATSGLIKVAAPFKYKSSKFEYAEDGKISDREGNKYREEHNPPASVIGSALLLAIKDGNVSDVMPDIEKGYIQIQLSKKDDSRLDKAKLSTVAAEGTSILTPNAGIIRLAAGMQTDFYDKLNDLTKGNVSTKILK